MGCLSTEAASCLFTIVNEVLSPDLNRCVTIFGSVARVKGIDTCGLIVLEQSLIDSVSEVPSDGHLEGHLLV